ncbi:hypothetical protein ACFVXR_30355 [Bacillus thuringiensis]|uniref:hypothetical protein n=1 Tax=Bacillus thuringiensis TaxID=1428 RepID=UPI0036E90190
MAALNQKYLKDHTNNIHTKESFSRALIEQAIFKAIQDIGAGGDVPSHEMDAQITFSPVEALNCLQVCVVIGGVKVCTHVE